MVEVVSERERVARIINPIAFRNWQSLYDYCLRQGDDEATARRYADDTHKSDCDKAFSTADAILATLRAGVAAGTAVSEQSADSRERPAPSSRMTTTEVAALADGLSKAQRDILERICAGQRLPLATRAQDSFRQAMRRQGLVHVVSNPRRWEALPLGLAVRNHFLASGGA